jgi:AAA domain
MEVEEKEHVQRHKSDDGTIVVNMSIREFYHLYHQNTIGNIIGQQNDTMLGFILFYASWNKLQSTRIRALLSHLMNSTIANQRFANCTCFGYAVQVDQSDDDLDLYIDGKTNIGDDLGKFQAVSEELPVLASVLVFNNESPKCGKNNSVNVIYVDNLKSSDVVSILNMPTQSSVFNASHLYMCKILNPVRMVVEDIELQFGLESDIIRSSGDALRIFIAGDRSSAGKSSTCLGMLGSLMKSGYTPDTLAYIKPATQSESTQLIQLYCNKHGIHCVPIGPLVYYRGFTRAFLAGEAKTTDEWLHRCSMAVDRIARGKRIVLVDGVGFPAVGSICGTSNAAVATVCGYPTSDNNNNPVRRPMGVLLVGGGGVGAAVDAFNLNATYFEHVGVPVLGGIFNKLPETGFYSLENCKAQVTAYFNQNEEHTKKSHRPFGFVPLFPRIAGRYALDHVDEFVQVFQSHVDIDAILDAARRVKDFPNTELYIPQPTYKRIKLLSSTSFRPSVTEIRSRQEIETEAINAGAAPSA